VQTNEPDSREFPHFMSDQACTMVPLFHRAESINSRGAEGHADDESLKAYLAPTGLVSEPRGDLTCRGDLRLGVPKTV
jgi:hypothetical protein